MIIENVKEKNPKDLTGWTPLHDAAERGYLDICKYIIGKVQDKNPVNGSKSRNTPLHIAAKYGHLEICRYMVGLIENKNPANRLGKTPSILAKENGHLKILEMFEHNL